MFSGLVDISAFNVTGIDNPHLRDYTNATTCPAGLRMRGRGKYQASPIQSPVESIRRRCFMPKGTIRRLISDRRFGFIRTAEGADLFFHRSGLQGADNPSIREGQEVEFEPGKGAGRPTPGTLRPARAKPLRSPDVSPLIPAEPTAPAPQDMPQNSDQANLGAEVEKLQPPE